LNSLGTHRSFPQVSVPRKPSVRFAKLDCLVLEFEFLSIFFVNLLLDVLQVIVIACFIYKVPES
jgi:hypothetical protein